MLPEDVEPKPVPAIDPAAPVDPVLPVAPAAVGLEGVPVTPVSTAEVPIGMAVAVPSTDHTGSDVNAETSDFPPNASTSSMPVSPGTATGAKPLGPDGEPQRLDEGALRSTEG